MQLFVRDRLEIIGTTRRIGVACIIGHQFDRFLLPFNGFGEVATFGIGGRQCLQEFSLLPSGQFAGRRRQSKRPFPVAIFSSLARGFGPGDSVTELGISIRFMGFELRNA